MPPSKRHTRFARRVSRGRSVVNLLACHGGVARRGDVTSGSRRKSPCHGIRRRGIFPLAQNSRSRRRGRAEMSLMCAKAACKATTGMCVHEKTTAVVVVLIAVGVVAGRALSLF